MQKEIRLISPKPTPFLCPGENIKRVENFPPVELMKKAKAGDSDAQKQIGDWYAWHGDLKHGYRNKEDFQRAEKWYKKSIKHGNAAAELGLAYLYLYGYFDKKGKYADYGTQSAMSLVKSSANKGNAEAQYFMWVKLSKEGQDNTEAVKWLEKAADQGLEVAKQDLGMCYASGSDKPKDEQKGLDLIINKEGEIKDIAEAEHFIGLKYLYSHHNIQRDVGKAVSWFERAIAHGDINSLRVLGSMYIEGKEVHQDVEKGVAMMEKAIEQGDHMAAINLTYLYKEGFLVSKNLSKAFDLTFQSATGGKTRAMIDLGEMYCLGAGVDKNKKECVNWLQRAVGQGSCEAQVKLANVVDQEERASRAKAFQKAWVEMMRDYEQK